ncbi:MAG: hypothetical protein ACRELF_15535 [Gemmataceae bacterium]
MSKLQASLCVVMVLAVGGCAQHPVKNGAQVTRYHVSRAFLRVAENYGYRPTIFNGNVMFCRYDEDLGSYVDKTYCYNTARMTLQLEREGRWGADAQQALEKQSAGCYSSKCGT